MNSNVLNSTVSEAMSSRLRGHVPGMGYAQTCGWKFFDAPSGTQMIDGCIDAIHDYMVTGVANRHAPSPTSDRTEGIIQRGRDEMRSLLRGDGYRVVFGQNMTSLNFALAHAVTRLKERRGATVLVSELEHFGNVDPWSRNFEECGGQLGWLRVDPETMRIDLAAAEQEFERHDVQVLAITLASNAIGTIPDVSPLAEMARELGALVAIDGVQAVFDQQVDLEALRPDLFLCSAYKFYGPHLGVALIRDELAESLELFKVTPASTLGSGKFETGTQNHEAIAGLVGTLDSLGQLSGGLGGAGARETIGLLSELQGTLASLLDESLRAMRNLTVFRADETEGPIAPTVAFRIAGMRPIDTAEALRERGFFVTNGDHYATALARRLEVLDDGGWVRAGIAGYTNEAEVRALAQAVDDLQLTAR